MFPFSSEFSIGTVAAQGFVAEERAAVSTAHIPNTGQIRPILLPDEIRMSIAIQVSDCNDTPAGYRSVAAQGFVAEERAAVSTAHIPNTGQIGPILLPDEIRMSIAIQVSDCNDSPARLWAAQEFAAEECAAVRTAHVPNTGQIGPILLPDQIR